MNVRKRILPGGGTAWQVDYRDGSGIRRFLQPGNPQFRELVGASEQTRKETLAALKKCDPKRAARHRLKLLGTSLRPRAAQ